MPAMEWLRGSLEARAVERRAAETARKKILAAVEAKIDEFAARIHAAYMTLPADARSPDISREFAELDPLSQESNRAAARRIPPALEAAGLRIVSGGEGSQALPPTQAQAWLERFLDLSAAEEHRGWCAFHEKQGWVPTKAQDDPKEKNSDPPRHPALVPWEVLREFNRDKDRRQVRIYLAIVHDLGFGVTRA
jgi:hypothetical protein